MSIITMKKRGLYLVWFQLALLTATYGQSIPKEGIVRSVFDKIPQETLYVHYNSSVLFSGETLYYKTYCLNTTTSSLSSLSKIAYVELFGPNNEFIFKHKIKLRTGEGQGDFFIPSDVPSGNYKLIGYTSWMKNRGTASFFEGDVMVINPYEKNRQTVLDNKNNTADKSANETKGAAFPDISKVQQGEVSLSIDKRNPKKRGSVSITLMSSDGEKGFGNYSLSVHKKNPFNSAPLVNATQFKNSSWEKQNVTNDSIYLPELRGELLSGKVISLETSQPVINKHISISIPGKAYVMDIVKTDEMGRFFFNLHTDYEGENAIFQVLDYNEEVDIQIEKHTSEDYKGLVYTPFRIDSQMKSEIVQRNIHYQIENAYSEIKRDSIIPLETNYPFFHDKDFDRFDLDDYTRFPTVRETFIEIVKNASIIKNSKGDPEFKVLLNELQLNSNAPPLVIVDGILLPKHRDIIEFGAKNINQILVFREKYFYGSKSYHGALVFETIDGNYQEKYDIGNAQSFELFKAQPEKKYFRQSYSNENSTEADHVPDYRHQLLWNPKIVLDQNKENIEFFTSDVTGQFEIRLEGFTNTGEPVSISEVLIVK